MHGVEGGEDDLRHIGASLRSWSGLWMRGMRRPRLRMRWLRIRPRRERCCLGRWDRRVVGRGVGLLLVWGLGIGLWGGVGLENDVLALSLALQTICSQPAVTLRNSAPQAQSMLLGSQLAAPVLSLEQVCCWDMSVFLLWEGIWRGRD